MTTTKPGVDVVIVGFGWAGSIAAKELVDEGLSVVVLEKGPLRTQSETFDTPRLFDELPYSTRNPQAVNKSRERITFRNNREQTALPMRQFGSFNPSSGTAGSGLTWSGHTFRKLPSDFVLRSHITERYGRGFIPEDMTIQDWGVTYQELEPFYDQFEYVAGISGFAGNVNGEIRSGGNPFEGPRQRDYPNPPLPRTNADKLFAQAAGALGYSPFPVPAANSTQDYTNPYGAQLSACQACGHCAAFGCTYSAKGSPLSTILPALQDRQNLELRHNAYVIRVNTTDDGARATGVTYINAMGEAVEQPAQLVILAAYGYNNPRLMLLSGIGQPYDPATGEGTIGRNYAYQRLTNVVGFYEGVNFNPYAAAGGTAMVIDDFNGDNFDHGPHDFIGGGFIGSFTSSGLPIRYHPTPPDAPRWGSGWKRAVVESYQTATTLNVHAACQSYRSNYLDLDPTYKDAWGQPLLRMTFDFGDNEYKMSNYITDRAVEIAQEMGAKQMIQIRREGPYDITQYQTTHNVGGAIMGNDPSTSAVNRYLQSWDVPNLFVLGSSAFPQNTGYNPTGTVGALAYWATDAIKTQYLRRPGALVS
ncbi:MAG: GMC family oxidoreductase [Elainellaceae cyanobacterium]